ncbi:glycosyltransferase family 2 protein [Mariniflexile sp.]|uniref:glycosyltransferase family 2 protein n=1 Tax=Mariniflexile sp. TaxID=1979402 RepID=UPI003566FD58
MDSQKLPLVSVVICFLNEQNFLEEAITSVLNQNYKNWELLLIDDGSNDKSTAIALNYEKKYIDKIQYLDHNNHINKGLSASRNLGIKKSKGDLIAFLDADDIWQPNKLSQQVAIFNNNPDIGLLLEASMYWFNWNDNNQDNILIPIGVEGNKVYKPPFLVTNLYPLGKGAAPCPSAIMVKRNAFENSGYFEESFKGEFALYEDQAFLSKMYLKEEVYVSSECNNMYRQHQDSIVQTVKSAGHYNKVRKYYLTWFKGSLKENNIKNSEIDTMVKYALKELNYSAFYNLKNKIFMKLKKILK